jgi:hypothetical protein
MVNALGLHRPYESGNVVDQIYLAMLGIPPMAPVQRTNDRAELSSCCCGDSTVNIKWPNCSTFPNFLTAMTDATLAKVQAIKFNKYGKLCSTNLGCASYKLQKTSHVLLVECSNHIPKPLDHW